MSIPMNADEAFQQLSDRRKDRPAREPGGEYCPYCGQKTGYPTDPTTHACVYCQQLLDHGIPLEAL